MPLEFRDYFIIVLTVLCGFCAVNVTSIANAATDCREIFISRGRWQSVSTQPVADGKISIEVLQLSKPNSVVKVVVPKINPISGQVRPYSLQFLRETIFRALRSNYDPRVKDTKLFQLLDLIDSKANSADVTLIIENLLLSQGAESVDGFARIFSGASELLPVEKIRRLQGKDSRATQMARWKGFDVYEVRDLFFGRSIPPDQMPFIRKEVMRWMIRFLESKTVDALKKSMFFSHVTTRSQQIEFERGFGFYATEEASGNRSDGVGIIMAVRGVDLLNVLKSPMREFISRGD